jgi:Secretion system C-terminal sorting domain
MYVNMFNAQVVCTPVTPNLTVSAYSYSLNLDINNDATQDFRIVTQSTSQAFSTVNIKAGQVGTGNFVMTNTLGALALTLNTPIGPTSSGWTQMNTTTDILMTNLVIINTGGNWANVIDRYLGLRIVVGANTYYGWARFTFESNTAYYRFKDYAFNSSPNQPILAGQGCASLSFPSFFLDPNSCQGHTTTVTANTGTLPVNGYTWSANPVGPAFSLPNNSVTIITFPSTGFYTVSLSVKSGTTTFVSSKSLTVYGFPTITPVISPTATCFNASPSLQVTLTGQGAGATTYTFYHLKYLPPVGYPDTFFVFNASPPLQFSVAGTVNGCSAGDTISIRVFNDINFNYLSPDSMCANTSATLSVVNLPGYINNYYWTQTPPGITTSFGNSVIVTPQVFPVNVSVTGYNPGCSETRTFSIIEKKYIYPILSGTSDTICLGEKTVLTASGSLNYIWLAPSGTIALGVANITVSPLTNTTYTINAVEGTCIGSTTYTQYVDLCVGILERTKIEDKTLLIWPNPANDLLTIDFENSNATENERVELKLVSSLGQLVREEELIIRNNTATIKMGNLLNGVYSLSLRDKTGQMIYQTKIIKQD